MCAVPRRIAPTHDRTADDPSTRAAGHHRVHPLPQPARRRPLPGLDAPLHPRPRPCAGRRRRAARHADAGRVAAAGRRRRGRPAARRRRHLARRGRAAGDDRIHAGAGEPRQGLRRRKRCGRSSTGCSRRARCIAWRRRSIPPTWHRRACSSATASATSAPPGRRRSCATCGPTTPDSKSSPTSGGRGSADRGGHAGSSSSRSRLRRCVASASSTAPSRSVGSSSSVYQSYGDALVPPIARRRSRHTVVPRDLRRRRAGRIHDGRRAASRHSRIRTCGG